MSRLAGAHHRVLVLPSSRSRTLSVRPVPGPEGSCVITCNWCGGRAAVDGAKALVAQIREVASGHKACEV